MRFYQRETVSPYFILTKSAWTLFKIKSWLNFSWEYMMGDWHSPIRWPMCVALWDHHPTVLHVQKGHRQKQQVSFLESWNCKIWRGHSIESERFKYDEHASSTIVAPMLIYNMVKIGTLELPVFDAQQHCPLCFMDMSGKSTFSCVLQPCCIWLITDCPNSHKEPHLHHHHHQQAYFSIPNKTRPYQSLSTQTIPK